MSAIVGRVQPREPSPDAPSPMRRHRVGAEIVFALLNDAIVRRHDHALGRIDEGRHPAPIDDPVPFVLARPTSDRQPAVAARTPRDLAPHAIADVAAHVSGDEIVVDQAPFASRFVKRLHAPGPHHRKQRVEGAIDLGELHRAQRKAKALARIARDHWPVPGLDHLDDGGFFALNDNLLAPRRDRLPGVLEQKLCGHCRRSARRKDRGCRQRHASRTTPRARCDRNAESPGRRAR